MPKRNSRKFSEKLRKVNSESQKKYKQKQQNIKWQCRICHSLNEDINAFCVQCYLGLHYYAYVNMHMFVASDNSFQQIYYPDKYNETSSDSMSQNSIESQNYQYENDEQVKNIKIDWVQNLLKDQ